MDRGEMSGLPFSSGIDVHRRVVGRRVQGGVRAQLIRRGSATVEQTVEERDGYRFRLPRNTNGCEGVIINTGGGVVAGDDISHDFAVSTDARVVITSPAAERVYRSHGAEARVAISLQLEADACLAWMPQETILYNQAQVSRCLDAEMADTSSLLICEITVFGRKAMGETLERGSFTDRWRIRRNGRLVFAENVALAGHPSAILSHKAAGDRASAMATVLYAAPDAAARLGAVRDVLKETSRAAAASAWNGLLCIRALADSGEDLRSAIVPAIVALRGSPMPRVWGL